MFLDSFETDRGVWLQACISFPFLGDVPGFSEALTAVLAMRGMVPLLNLAFRVVATSSGELRRILILLAPESSGAQLRRFAASFSRLELIAPGSVEFANDAEALDSNFLGAFPDSHCRAVVSGFGRGRVWFAVDFRLGPSLDDLILEARSLGLDLAYQMHARPLGENTQEFRTARHNLLNAQSLESVPLKVLQLQQTLTERLGSASYLVEEIVGVSPSSGQTWLLSALDRLFATRHSQLGFDSPGFSLGNHTATLGAGFHSSIWNPAAADEVCTMAAGGSEVVRLIAWHPAAVLSRELRVAVHPPADIAEPAHQFMDAPEPYSGTDPFLFISYKHSDLAAILPFLHQLAVDGFRFWYDRGIPGSSEWMYILESRIEQAKLLVVFLSQSAVDSKYVRREILMADTLNKPILSLTIENPELRWGLKLLLPQYQMQDVNAKPVSLAVREALAARFPNERS